jgi:hypothetical protein
LELAFLVALLAAVGDAVEPAVVASFALERGFAARGLVWLFDRFATLFLAGFLSAVPFLERATAVVLLDLLLISLDPSPSGAPASSESTDSLAAYPRNSGWALLILRPLLLLQNAPLSRKHSASFQEALAAAAR